MPNTVNKQFIAAGSITFPSAVTTATFKGIGGGGGGGAGEGSAVGGGQGVGGGAGGAACLGEITVPVKPNAQYDIVIGAGGAGGAGVSGAAGNNGNPGGDTIVTENATGNVIARFRGASGGSGGGQLELTPGWGGTDENFGSPIANRYDATSPGTVFGDAGGSIVLAATRAGGRGAFNSTTGSAGGYDQRQDGTVVLGTALTQGGAGGAPNAGGAGGGGGGGGSALATGGNGGAGGAGQGGNGTTPTANTGAGGGGGGGSGTVGAPLPGGNGGNGASGFLEVIYEVAA